MTYLITGAAGFVGFHLCKRLLSEGKKVIGIDNLNDYYDVKLKKNRIKFLEELSSDIENWNFFEVDLIDKLKLEKIFNNYKPSIIINLAAQAGVRYSIDNPEIYLNSNIIGFGNILECCRKYSIENFLFASSSSVYGANTLVPFNEDHNVDHPVSLYAASKKSNEIIAHSYSHLFKIPITGLRLFTVYGPWGRPDMAPMIFAKSIFEKVAINIFNYGKMKRDFTYIDDVIEGIIRCSNKPATPDYEFDRSKPNPSTSLAPFRIFNLGNSEPIQIMKFIEVLEDIIGIKAIKNFSEMQPGDVETTYADCSKVNDWIDFIPQTSLIKGIEIFIDWYKDYYFEKKNI
ncbi:dTDP-glucose 4,6-dehydratase [Prochlorococcus marinus str. MIT 9201]|uniref:dTDP-glucose 4,6-dehydratase n=1 Tax=Prochlorococcus marinus str. MIT 9201 TaxID=93057 RepID=A0A0A2A847_PROMR|nr:NAD-dependent epimerase/dehydratase family protein [Prochlorococcus marinus]KGF96684.1 dTDP-glucose 4,6-dehydratase [Prochlorococcus marinus str. MIT 9201]